MIYQSTLRRELHRSLGFEWEPVGTSTGMAEIAGVGRDSIAAWSRRPTALREWDTHDDVPVTARKVTATAPRQQSPDLSTQLIPRRDVSVQNRRANYTGWLQTADGAANQASLAHAPERTYSRRQEPGPEF